MEAVISDYFVRWVCVSALLLGCSTGGGSAATSSMVGAHSASNVDTEVRPKTTQQGAPLARAAWQRALQTQVRIQPLRRREATWVKVREARWALARVDPVRALRPAASRMSVEPGGGGAGSGGHTRPRRHSK